MQSWILHAEPTIVDRSCPEVAVDATDDTGSEAKAMQEVMQNLSEEASS